MQSSYIIIGSGGHSRVVIDTAISLGHDVIGVIDLDFKGADEKILGVPIIGGPEQLKTHPKGTVKCFVGIGDNAKRAEHISYLYEAGYEIGTLIHPESSVSPSAVFGTGTLVHRGALISAESKVGVGCILNTGCIVDHESLIADYTHIGPGCKLAGRVRVGQSTFVGIGSTIADGVTIGRNVTIGAGSVITKNVEDGKTVVGVNRVL